MSLRVTWNNPVRLLGWTVRILCGIDPMHKKKVRIARSSIEVLPNECLFEVFRRLRDGRARSVAACVSKRWLMLVSNVHKSEMCFPTTDKEEESVGRGNLVTRHFEDTDVTLAAYVVGNSSRGQIQKINIQSNRKVTNAVLKAIAYGSPSLLAFSLWNVPHAGDEGLIEIAKECHKMEEIELWQCPLITDKGLIAIANNIPCLTSVSIGDCPLVGDEGVTRLVFSTGSALSELKLQSLSIGDKTLAEIGLRGKALTTPVLIGLQGVTTNGFSLMGKLNGLKKLVSLTITSCSGMRDEVLHAIGECCPRLKRINLCRCLFLSDSGIRVFVEVASSLENLHLEECHRITLSGVLGALSTCGSKLKTLALVKCNGISDFDRETPTLFPCESLHSLSITSCPRFGNRGLAMVGTLCPYLQNIDLIGLGWVTDSGLLPLVESFCAAGLIKVNLGDCVNLTDKVVCDIARLHGRTLKLLCLHRCFKVTDASLVVLARNCLVLEYLVLSKCSITDFGVATLTLEGLGDLKELSISGCSRVSDMSMPYLLKLKKKLSRFDFSGCDSLSDSVMRELDWTPSRFC